MLSTLVPKQAQRAGLEHGPSHQRDETRRCHRACRDVQQCGHRKSHRWNSRGLQIGLGLQNRRGVRSAALSASVLLKSKNNKIAG